jgi:hypothetical protein
MGSAFLGEVTIWALAVATLMFAVTAFLGEVTIWALAVATLMFAVTLQIGITYGIIALALIWGMIAQVRLRRKRARETGKGPV